MFTGLVAELGRIEQVVNENAGRRLEIRSLELAKDSPLRLGESIAVSGCCLTAVAMLSDRFTVQAGPETLARTNLGTKRAGDRVNLEHALNVGDRLGGHFVSGHIDTTARLRERRREGEWEFLAFGIEPGWTRLMVSKGSIAVNGVSLTLVNVWPDAFSVMLIPHTLEVTTLGIIQPGDRVNIEVDILAKHVEKLLQGGALQSLSRLGD